MRILIIDNYDSFVFNIVQLIKETAYKPLFDVVKNNAIPFDTLNHYQGIILSPGPGIPSEAGDLMKLIDLCATTHSILGICLGHQAIIEYFGGKIINLRAPMHGHRSYLTITDSTDSLFRNIKDGTAIGRYHSWSADKSSLPACLTVSSYDEEGNVMSVKHNNLPIHELQFHPESYISECGSSIINNWLESISSKP